MRDGPIEAGSRFGRLRIEGFRRLAKVDFELRPLTVLIGANGIGKTSVLEVLTLLARSAQGALASTLSEFSGLAAILTYDRSDSLSLGISMSTGTEAPLDYLLRLRPQGAAYTIEEETLAERQRADGSTPRKYIDSHGADIGYFDGIRNEMISLAVMRSTGAHNPIETSLCQVPLRYSPAGRFRGRLGTLTHYHGLDVGPRSPIRLPQPLQPASLPGKNGEELISCLFNLRETERDRFDALEDALRSSFPRFERLDFPPVAAGTLAMTWREAGFSRPLYMHQLSEGTLRFLWLATLLQSPGLTALTLIDEPEVSLHPELLALLADLLREAALRTQVVVATHSDRLIRFLKPSEVTVMDADEDGLATLRWADELDLDEWLSNYSLDELWSNGRLGARS